MCFNIRFERTALHTQENCFQTITSCLGISRWKNREQIKGCGILAAAKYPDPTCWTLNWREEGGSVRMIEISKRESFYQQDHCGCIYPPARYQRMAESERSPENRARP